MKAALRMIEGQDRPFGPSKRPYAYWRVIQTGKREFRLAWIDQEKVSDLFEADYFHVPEMTFKTRLSAVKRFRRFPSSVERFCVIQGGAA